MVEIFTYTPRDYFGSNTYLISSDDEWAVVDPSVDYSEVEREHPDIRGKIKYILLTHAHFDHILMINTWLSNNTTVIVGKADKEALSNPSLNCYLGFLGIEEGYYGPSLGVDESDVLTLGKKDIRIICCPGHTPGGVSYKIDNSVFVGDTLFASGGYGRFDLPGGDYDTLMKTLMRLFICLNDDRIVYPGHGLPTTIKDSRKFFI